MTETKQPLTESGDPDFYWGPLKAGYYACDMCDRKVPWLRNINDGAWAICYWCLDDIYGDEEE